MIEGVIFDMDGVLLDSESLYLRFWTEVCADFGYRLDKDMALALRSTSGEVAEAKFKEWFGEKADYTALRDLRRKKMSDFIDKHGVDIKDGAIEIIGYVKQKGLKLALATSSPAERAERHLSPCGIFDKFDATICGSMVKQSKPAPDIYIQAANALGLPCCNCLAVEDSPNGIISAHKAGCVTAMVPDLTEPDDNIIPMINYLCRGLTELKSII